MGGWLRQIKHAHEYSIYGIVKFNIKKFWHRRNIKRTYGEEFEFFYCGNLSYRKVRAKNNNYHITLAR